MHSVGTYLQRSIGNQLRAAQTQRDSHAGPIFGSHVEPRVKQPALQRLMLRAAGWCFGVRFPVRPAHRGPETYFRRCFDAGRLWERLEMMFCSDLMRSIAS